MAGKIHEYSNEAIKLNQGDYFDIDKDVNNDQTLYQSNKISWRTLKGQFQLMTQIDTSLNITGTTKQSLIGSIVGSLTVPQNTFVVGDTFELKMSGTINNPNNENLRITVETDSGDMLNDTGVLTLPHITSNAWELSMIFVIRAIGVAGVAQIESNGCFIYNKDSNDRYEGKTFAGANTTTFDTTLLNTLNVFAQWGSVEPQNIINSRTCTLVKLY